MVGCECAAAVRRIDPTGGAWLAEVRTRTGAKASATRRDAIVAIGIIGPPATPPVLTLLADATADSGADVRYAAAQAYDAVEAPAPVAVPALAVLLTDAERDVRDRAVQSLRKLGAAAAAVEAGKMLARDRQVADRRGAGRVLQALGPGAAPARGALESATDDADDEVRTLAQSTLLRFGEK